MEALLSESAEDYLEQIYLLSLQNKVVRVTDLAAKMSVQKSTAITAIKNLEKKGLVTKDRYRDIRLTEEGEQNAGKILGRHNIIKDFFTDFLKLDETSANEEACRMEHFISESSCSRFVQFISFITSKASKDGLLEEFNAFLEKNFHPQSCLSCTLKELQPGDLARIKGYAGENREYRQKLISLGLIKGRIIKMIGSAPFGDPVNIALGEQQITLRKAEACELLLRKVEA